MVLSIEEAWEETRKLESHKDMTSRFWVFRAFYGILTSEQKDRYVANVIDMRIRDTKFKRDRLAATDPGATAKEVICHYSFILGYHPNCAEDNDDINFACLRGEKEYKQRLNEIKKIRFSKQ